MSSGGNGELVSQKWCSILNHVCNVHEGHGAEFPRCEHGDLGDRLWMRRGIMIYIYLHVLKKKHIALTKTFVKLPHEHFNHKI